MGITALRRRPFPLFKTGSTLTTASNSAVVLIGGATPCNNNITWQVGSSATLGSATSFVGNILASASVTLNTGATSTGSMYGNTGTVTMDTNNVSTCGGAGGKRSPAITTTPSGSVPAGGNISDSARLIGGVSPTGSVMFSLYGPGDATCSSTPVATRTGTLVAGTASSGNVTAGAAGTYNWVAKYSGDTSNSPVTSPCGSEKVVVTAQKLTGRAYGLAARAGLLVIPLNVPPIPDTGFVSTTSSSTTSTPCLAALAGDVSAHVLCAKVIIDAPVRRSTASASVADATADVALVPKITLRTVQSTSTTTCAGSSGTTTIAFLKVGGTVVSVPTNVAPNTRRTVEGVTLVLNEQMVAVMY